MFHHVKISPGGTSPLPDTPPLDTQLAVVGFVYVEVVLGLPFVAPDRGTERFVDSLPLRLGGGLNTASALRLFSTRVSLVFPQSGPLVDAAIRQALERLGIDERSWAPPTQRARPKTTASDTAAISLVLVAEDGERSFVSARDLAALSSCPFDLEADWIHAAGVSEARALWPRLLKSGARLSAAGSWAPADLQWLARREAMPLELVVLNRSEAGVIADSLEGALTRMATVARRVVVTDGERGGLAWADGRRLEFSSTAPTRPIDTTGAGDAFCGGLIAGFAAGATLPVALDWARACADLVLQQAGGVIEPEDEVTESTDAEPASSRVRAKGDKGDR